MSEQEVVQMSRNYWIGAVCAGILMTAGPGLAHHSFSAEFDADAPVQLTGPVAKVELINPHTWIHLDVTTADGTVERWMVEGGTPNALMRRGISRDSIPVGTVIVVSGFRAKDGTLKANGRNLAFEDGRTLFMGSSGTGAPKDGRDPTQR
jgi:hypothetical protein